jgi:hypothetical protein
VRYFLFFVFLFCFVFWFRAATDRCDSHLAKQAARPAYQCSANLFIRPIQFCLCVFGFNATKRPNALACMFHLPHGSVPWQRYNHSATATNG